MLSRYLRQAALLACSQLHPGRSATLRGGVPCREDSRQPCMQNFCEALCRAAEHLTVDVAMVGKVFYHLMLQWNNPSCSAILQLFSMAVIGSLQESYGLVVSARILPNCSGKLLLLKALKRLLQVGLETPVLCDAGLLVLIKAPDQPHKAWVLFRCCYFCPHLMQGVCRPRECTSTCASRLLCEDGLRDLT